MKKSGTILGAGTLAVMAAFVLAPAQAAEVTLKGASCFPMGSPVTKPWAALINEINKRGKGVVQIKLIGGAPAIGSPFTLTQKMAKGAYDVVGCTEGYFGNVLIEGAALRFSDYSYAELRKRGAIDYLQKLFHEKNIHYLARHHDFGPFHLWLNKKITGPDLTGLHLRISPIYKPFFTALGATVQRSNIAQVYTYMENNTVQGYGWPALGWVPSWVKVTKYRVEPGFYQAPLHTVFNLDSWNALSKAQQDLLSEVGLEFEGRAETDGAAFKALLKKQNDKTLSQGLTAITLTGADREKWVSTAKTTGWAEVLERSPTHGPKLRELFSK